MSALRSCLSCALLVLLLVQAVPASADTQPIQGLVNFETPHVHPLDLTPDNSLLLMVNTAAHRLEVYDTASTVPALIGTVAVGMDPVSVRARSNTEAWVVNHLSDSVSVVDLQLLEVVASLATGNEPADVVFAGSPQRAFVSVSEANRIDVFNPNNLSAAPVSVPVAGEDPRALAVSPDGSTVYAAIFESGNATTAVSGSGSVNANNVVSRPEGPYAGVSPPPNQGTNFVPAIAAGLPAPPATALIVRKADDARWLDDNNGDWSVFVSGALSSLTNRVAGWDMPDNDVAIIDANNLTVSYQSRLMNIVMAISVNPASGAVSVVGTEARNEVRFEPNLNGVFLRVNTASFVPGGSASISDLNDHLDYSSPTVGAAQRARSIGDPRGIAWRADGQSALVTGMGSNNVIAIDTQGNRLGRLSVGEGPTGIVLNDTRGIGYVLNKFSGTLSVIDLDALTQTAEVAFDDPTPDEIRNGRPFLYNTHISSGLGHISCASCHVDARTDRLSWDLGDPSGAQATVLRASNSTGDTSGTVNVHPMKGPMLTQSLQDIMGFSTLHWRGDRADLAAFNGAFVSLMGAPQEISAAQMDAFGDFLGTIHLPPNPYRNIDNSRPTSVTLPSGFVATTTASFNSLRGANSRNNNCMRCHMNNEQRNDASNPELGQAFVAPAWAPLYDRLGFWPSLQNGSTAGFGFFHDGADDIHGAARTDTAERQSDMLAELLTLEGPGGPLAGVERRQDAHAGVGQQVTLGALAGTGATARLNQLQAIAENSVYVELIARQRVSALVERGYLYAGNGTFQSDVAAVSVSQSDLLALASSSAVTFTLVADGMGTRLGLDRNNNGIFDGDEDTDGDGVPDQQDAFPLDPNESQDTDGDGVGDNADVFPNDPTESADSDGDGIGDNADPDSGDVAPVIVAVPDQVSSIGASVSLVVSASDVGGGLLLFNASGLPQGLSIDGQNGLISGTTERLEGTQVTVTVTDTDGNAAATSFSWQVSADVVANVAPGGVAEQSSALADFLEADNAHDGNTSGEFEAGSIIHTDFDSQAYWQIDLGRSYQISRIEIFNREDCCAEALQDFHVLVSDAPFVSATLQGAQSQSGVSDFFQPGIAPRQTTELMDLRGRYVRVQLEGSEYLQLAEVEIYGTPLGGGGDNLAPVVENPGEQQNALGGSVQLQIVASDPESDALTFAATGLPDGVALDAATGLLSGTLERAGVYSVLVQVSDGPNNTSVAFVWRVVDGQASVNLAPGGVAQQSSTLNVGVDLGAGKANDGNTSGDFSDSSLAHTDFELQPWWSVDLGASQFVERVVLHNRSDCCASALADVYVLLSAQSFGAASLQQLLANPSVESVFVAGEVGASVSLPVGVNARHVRVQLAGTEYLQLAEVEVWGRSGDGGQNVAPTLTSPGDQSMQLGESVNLLPVASDADGDALTFSAQNLPTGLVLQSSTGLISGVVTQAGVFATTLSVSDGSATTSVSFVWTVTDGSAQTNLALTGVASQSSTFAGFAFLAADRAADGNRDGDFEAGSLTHTELNAQPWWEIDLGAVYDLSEVRIFNREDCCAESLSNVHVLISDSPFVSTDLAAATAGAGVVTEFVPGELGRDTRITLGENGGGSVSGRYVRVQLQGTDYLQLAEVEILGQSR